MKTFITEFRSYLKTFALASLMLGMAMFNAACGSSGGGGPAPLNAIYGNYAGIGGVNGGSQAVGDWGQDPARPDVELILSFTQAAGGYGGYGVAASGVMFVQYPICGLQPGQYSVQAQTPGMVSGNMVGNMQLIASGPGGQAAIMIYQASVDGGMGPTRGVNGGYYPLRLASYGGGIAIQTSYGACPNMSFY
jgi:hypothetical protein